MLKVKHCVRMCDLRMAFPSPDTGLGCAVPELASLDAQFSHVSGPLAGQKSE